MEPLADRSEPDPIDVHVGLRMRTIRREKRMSQDTLAKALGITFQQIQKYERGTNRVSASMLVKAAQALGCPTAHLLPPSDEAETPPVTPQLMQAVAAIRGVEELIQAFARIASEEERAEVLRLASILAKRPG